MVHEGLIIRYLSRLIILIQTGLIWSITFANAVSTKTLVCRLPSTPRRLKKPWLDKNENLRWTVSAVHLQSTPIPNEIDRTSY